MEAPNAHLATALMLTHTDSFYADDQAIILSETQLECHSQVVCLGRAVSDPPTPIIPKDRQLCFIAICIALIPSVRSAKQEGNESRTNVSA